MWVNISLWFWFAFPWWLKMLSLFSWPLGHLHFHFGKMSVQFHFLIGLFVSVMLSCTSYLYMLDINPLLVISFVNIFSRSLCCLFILSMVSFAVQKLLSLIRSHLFVFAFISFTLGDRSKKTLLRFMSRSVLTMFSSRSFIVFSLTFRSLIHFEFIFIYCVLISFFCT